MGMTEKHNVTMNDGAVVVVKPLDKTRAIVYTAVWLVFGPNRLYLGSLSRQPADDWGLEWNLAIAIVITAAWLYLMVGLRVVTWFEPWAAGVRRRNLLFFTSFIPYERIGGIGSVAGSGPFAGGVYFKLIDKADPLGKGYPLTRRMDPGGEEFSYFNGMAVPAINTVIFGAADGPGADAREVAALRGVPPERVECYAKSGNVFSRRLRPLRAKLALLVSGILFLSALVIFTQSYMNGGDAAAILGLILLLYGASQVSTFSIDVEQGEIVLSRWFGKSVRRIPLDESVSLLAERSYGNFMYLGTRLLVRFRGKWLMGEYVLGTAHPSAVSLAGLERETRLLLAAAYANRQRNEGKDPGGDSPFLVITFTQDQSVKI